MTPWYRVAKAVGWVTFLEIARDKVLYNIFFFGTIVIGLGFLGAQMTYTHPERMILDFSMTAVALSCALVAALNGSLLLNKEIERRTAFVAFSHPISKGRFLFGKFCGLALILVLNWALLSSLFLSVLFFFSESLLQNLNATVFWGLLFGLLQSLVLASITLFFSTFTASSLALMFTAGFFLIGTNLSNLKNLATKSALPGVSEFFNIVAAGFPNFEHFNLGTWVTYGLPVSGKIVLFTVLYWAVLTAIFLSFAAFIIRKREF